MTLQNRDSNLTTVAHSPFSASSPQPAEHWSILGAGAAGLSVGYFAAKHGMGLTLFEAGSEVGGSARTIRSGEFFFDTGAHRFHDKDPEVTHEMKGLLGGDLLEANAPSQIVCGRRRIDFPLSPLNLLTTLGPLAVAEAAWDLLRARLAPARTFETFADLAVSRYGYSIAKTFLLDYSAKLWGVPPEELGSSVSGQRLKGLNLRTFFLETMRGRRAKTEHLDGGFYYPRYGIGQLMDALAQACGQKNIRTRSRLTRVFHSDGRITHIQINDREKLAVSRVISSLPLNVFLQSLDPPPPPEILDMSRSLNFRHIVLVALFLNRPQVSANASLYFPEPDVPFTRAYEPKHRSPAMSPSRQTSLVIEIPCGANDSVWQADRDSLVQMVTRRLIEMNLIQEKEILSAETHFLPYAYPVLDLNSAATAQKLLNYLTGFSNLKLAGRCALFRYVSIHDVIRDSRLLVEELMEAVKLAALN